MMNLYVKSYVNQIIYYFMNWNQRYSKGEKVIVDIQGVEKDYNYELTDPAVQSINVEYGEKDLGLGD